MTKPDNPYVFRAGTAKLKPLSPTLQVKEARMLGGMTVRYQERAPGPRNDGPWCETGHTAYVISGQLSYEFADGLVEIGPGDIVHIPAGPAHRHRPSNLGTETVKYFITEFS